MQITLIKIRLLSGSDPRYLRYSPACGLAYTVLTVFRIFGIMVALENH
jgi:hypothetical protein